MASIADLNVIDVFAYVNTAKASVFWLHEREQDHCRPVRKREPVDLADPEKEWGLRKIAMAEL